MIFKKTFCLKLLFSVQKNNNYEFGWRRKTIFYYSDFLRPKTSSSYCFLTLRGHSKNINKNLNILNIDIKFGIQQ